MNNKSNLERKRKTAEELFCACQDKQDLGYDFEALPMSTGGIGAINTMDEVYGAVGALATLVGGTVIENLVTSNETSDENKELYRGVGEVALGIGGRVLWPNSDIIQRPAQAMTDIGFRDILNGLLGGNIKDALSGIPSLVSSSSTTTTTTSSALSTAASGSCGGTISAL